MMLFLLGAAAAQPAPPPVAIAHSPAPPIVTVAVPPAPVVVRNSPDSPWEKYLKMPPQLVDVLVVAEGRTLFRGPLRVSAVAAARYSENQSQIAAALCPNSPGYNASEESAFCWQWP